MINLLSLSKRFFSPGWLETGRPYLIILIVGLLLYGQTLFFNYTYWDDSTLILDRQEVLRDFKNIPAIFSTDAFSAGSKFYYRPILSMSFMLDAQLGGRAPFVYHLDNLLLHLLAALMVFSFFKRIRLKTPIAFFLSLLFLVHPALSQAVAWLPGRNDSLATIFVLLSFFAFQRFSRSGRLSAYLSYLALFFLALLTKEIVVVLPILIIVYSWTVGRDDKLANRDRWLLLFGSAAAGFIWFLLRHLALGAEKVGLIEGLISVWKTLPDAFMMSGKMILPFNLSVLPATGDSGPWLSLIGWILVLVALLVSRRRQYSYLIFGAAWFLFFLLPPFMVSDGLPYFLEHRLYLPLIGFLIMIGEIDCLKSLTWPRRRTVIGALFILLLFGTITFIHSRHFRNPLVFWSTAVKDSPRTPLAYRNRGVVEYLSGDLVQAAEDYRQALLLNPDEPMAHNNLGVVYLVQKNFSAAVAEFQKELLVNPGYDKALLNLGEAAYFSGDEGRAVSYWRAALRSNPDNKEAALRLNNLGKPLR